MHPAQELEERLTDAEKLSIVCHNNPDPDCLASAFALGRIAVSAGIDEHHILSAVISLTSRIGRSSISSTST